MSRVISVVPVIDTSAYVSGDVLAAATTLVGAGARKGMLTSITIVDVDDEQVQIDFFFFKAAPTGTYTFNTAFAVDAADVSKLIGMVTVNASDYVDAGTGDAIAVKSPINWLFEPTADDNLYFIPVVRGTPTFAAATDLRFDFGIVDT